MISAQILFKTAAVFYGLSLVSALVFRKKPITVLIFMLAALAANAASLTLRYLAAWPMLPMYLGPVALPFCLGILSIFNKKNYENNTVFRLILFLILFLSLTAVFFPKDFYMPFIKSKTVLSHLFLLFGVTGKSCFLTGSAWAIAGFIGSKRKQGKNETRKSIIGILTYRIIPVLQSRYFLQCSMRWIVWGFSLLTLSMFSGELWSYIGWGTPVVWDDAAITTTMAIWFFYICLLHLHHTGTWTPQARGCYAASGVFLILGLNSIPDLGPFRWPF
ncbi:MAG: cytochrome c biogenesis protein [Proteobacteria bacterium]|nr:cytochrome c biogenesis protein [Pseudomonadota bacterium]